MLFDAQCDGSVSRIFMWPSGRHEHGLVMVGRKKLTIVLFSPHIERVGLSPQLQLLLFIYLPFFLRTPPSPTLYSPPPCHLPLNLESESVCHFVSLIILQHYPRQTDFTSVRLNVWLFFSKGNPKNIDLLLYLI